MEELLKDFSFSRNPYLKKKNFYRLYNKLLAAESLSVIISGVAA
jgi:hypothetical protein